MISGAGKLRPFQADAVDVKLLFMSDVHDLSRSAARLFPFLDEDHEPLLELAEIADDDPQATS